MRNEKTKTNGVGKDDRDKIRLTWGDGGGGTERGHGIRIYLTYCLHIKEPRIVSQQRLNQILPV